MKMTTMQRHNKVTKVMLEHSSGKRRFGYVASMHGKVVRVRWSVKSSEGVDINLATKKSPLGAWTLIGEVKQGNKTRMVLGYKITLVEGNRYLATRPMLEGDIFSETTEKLPVTIVDLNNPNGDPVLHVDDMPYDKANDFLNAFNCGKTSWDGRVW
jgi:hypothetical protein